MRAWVAGASGAWGRAVTVELIERGFDLVVLGRHDIPDLARWAAHRGRRWSHQPYDLADPAAALPDESPDALFWCAVSTSGDEAALVGANYLAPVRAIRETAERMAGAGGGAIGVWLGQNARLGLPGLGPYSAAQGALWTWCEAFEPPPGITLTRVIPPRVASPTAEQLAGWSGRRARTSPPRAERLVDAVLDGRRRAGRRPWGAAAGTLLR